MAHHRTNVPPEVGALRAALHKKHEQHIQTFQQKVVAERAIFEGRVDAARRLLLAKHMRDEIEFWNKHEQGPKPIKGATPTSTRAQAASHATATPRRTTPASHVPLSSVPPSKALPSSRIPQVQPTQSGLRPPPKSATEVIDLCDSDDDAPQERTVPARKPVVQSSAAQQPPARPTVAQQPTARHAVPAETVEEMCIDETSVPAEQMGPCSIPSASLKLFGNTSRNFVSTSERMRIKYEERQDGHPALSSPFVSPSSPSVSEFHGLANSSPEQPLFHPGERRSSIALQAQRAASAIPPPSSLNCPPSQRFSTPTAQPLPRDRWPEIPFSSLRQQQHDRSAILKQHTPLPRNHTILALEQQRKNGGFVNQVLRNERSHSLAPELQNVLNARGGAIDMEMREESRPAGFASHVMAPTSSTLNTDKAADCEAMEDMAASKIIQERSLEGTTPARSHPSLQLEPSPRPADGESPLAFKKPSVPASAVHPARQSAAPEALTSRAGTVDSWASSFTIPATSRSQRGASVASRFSDASSRTMRSGKRTREINLSSDEDEVSDYAPSEPDSPLANKPTRQAKDTKVFKKAKVDERQRVEKVRGKNGFGFNVATKTKPKVPIAQATPPMTPGKKSTSSTPSAPSNPVAPRFTTPKSPFSRASSVRAQSVSKSKSTAAPASRNSTANPLPQPKKRRAALASENAIHRFYEEAEEFATECAIEDADQVEEARLPSDMRHMSITPSASNTRTQHVGSPERGLDAEESVEMLVDTEPRNVESTAACTPRPVAANLHDSQYGRDACSRGGESHQSKYQASVADADDESEPDVSGYYVRNGVIEEVEELDLTGEV